MNNLKEDKVSNEANKATIQTSLDNSKTIHLSSHSFIDEEEKEFLSWRVRDCILFARKAKKEVAA